MITRYGLFWSERDVYWRRDGGLQGVVLTYGKNYGKNNKQIAGEDAEKNDSKPDNYNNIKGIYALYNQLGHLVYVGQSGGGNNTIYKRILEHRRGRFGNRWQYFSWFGFEQSDEKSSTKFEDMLKQIEAVCIAVANPDFNKKDGSFLKALQVKQVSHEKAEGNIDAKLDRLNKKLETMEKAINSKKTKAT